MIEVVVYSRDIGAPRARADAETPEDATFVAKTLLEDEIEAGTLHPRASFYNDGRLVRAGVSRGDLTVTS